MRNAVVLLAVLLAACAGLDDKRAGYWKKTWPEAERVEIYTVKVVAAYCYGKPKAVACTVIGPTARIYLPEGLPEEGRFSRKCVLLHEMMHAMGYDHAENANPYDDGMC